METMAVVGDGFAVAGYRALLEDEELEGIDLDIVDLNFDETAEVSVPDQWYAREKWHLPLTVLECDFLISVPVLKVHGGIGMTSAMKNLVGIAPGMVYGWIKMMGYPPHSGNPGIPHHEDILDETIVDLVSMAGVDFAVVDAIVGMERWYDEGNRMRLNTIVASADIVAADAVSSQLAGFNPFDFEYLTLAAYKGLGQCDPDRIKIKGPFAPQKGRDEEFIDVVDPGALPGQNGWSAPVYFHDDRIDLDEYYDDPFDCVVYAYAEFTAPKNQDAELWLGSDEGLRVWINGEMVYDHAGRRRHRLPNDREQIRVQEGRNTVLVRSDQSRSRYDFSLNVCEVESDPRYDGNRVWGLKFSVPATAVPQRRMKRQ